MLASFRSFLLLLLGLSTALVGAASSAAESEPLLTDHLRSRLVAAADAAVPGQTLKLGLLLEHDPGWHTYWKNPGDSGLPTRMEFTLPDGLVAGEIEWPLPERQPAGGLVNFGYSHTELLPVSVAVPADFAADSITITLKASWLICELECIPGSGEYRLALPVAQRAQRSAQAATFERAAARQAQRVDVEAQYSAENSGVAIEIRLDGPLAAAFATGADGWTLMPATPQILANADPPRFSIAQDELRVEVARSEFFASAPERIELLLSNGDRGYTVLARHQAASVSAAAAASGQEATEASSGFNDSNTAGAPVGLWLALLLAFAGGLVLNLMPCVFPVLSLKALGAVESAHDAAEMRRHGLWYTLGVLASVLLVAGLLLALRAGGEAIGWGFQLQEPGFVAAIALLLFAMGLSFSGLYEFGAGMTGMGQQLTEGGGRRGAFFTGVLACVVASPCTAPFMGTALGAALVLPTHEALLVFTFLALGLAFPMLLLGYVPALARLLPRPGAWMQTFRELLAFPLYLTVLWLAWVFGRQTGMLALTALGGGFIAIAFALWLLRRAQGRERGALPLRALAAMAMVSALALPLLAPREVGPAGAAETGALHEPWTPARFAALRDEGRPVLVNMTADWCITCLANERVALSSTEFADALRTRGVVYLKGDWTRQDAGITAYLESFGRSGVPLYVLYPARGEPIVLPQLLTPAIVREALEALPPARADG
ncbi:protein-disulfide reductase DsbD family protein [Aquimonas voraii]|uniref:protein-disulfide reductase DsbD family protein n=1 Tax=Aquimonas voraii TaxID=265719 RepID=UPI0015A0E853|nr:thioredoxin family protein [Aquimonas voraii]